MSSQYTPHRPLRGTCRSLVLGIAFLALGAVGGGHAGARDEPKKEKVEGPAMNAIAIELVLPKDHRYKPSDKVDVEVLFRNTSKEEVKIAVIEGEQNVLFFDFLLVGDRGMGKLVHNGGEWYEPSIKPVKLVSIAPGATYRATVKEAFRLGDYKFAANERYSVLVIYRDYLFGHGQDDKKLWKGAMTSSTVPLNLVLPPERKE